MIRNKAARYRNLQNLHVIPTAPTLPPVLPVVKPVSDVLITVKPTVSIPIQTASKPETPVTPTQNKSNKNFKKNMFCQNKPRYRKRGRKNRKRKDADNFSSRQNLIPNKNYDWFNTGFINPISFENCPPPVDNTSENVDMTEDTTQDSDEKTNAVIEEAENYLETHGEEDFEEVEVASVDAADDEEASGGEVSAGEASVDADGKQEILVGFRTSKIHYLSYKKKCFFKPKVYNFSSQRTFVNCLNIQDNCSVDVDVVSEADYEIEYEGEILDQNESQDFTDKNEIEEKKDDTTDVSKKIYSQKKVDVEGKKETVHVKTVKDDTKLKNKGTKEMKSDKSRERDHKTDVKLRENSLSVDTKSVKSKSSTDGKIKTNESKDEQKMSNKVSKLEVKIELANSSSQKKDEKLEANKVIESSVSSNEIKKESIQRIYKSSVEKNDDIHQGKCAIQSILDSWESHLIGLEYLIEIQNKDSTLYNCVLCSEDLQEKEFSSTNVISHVNGRKHVVKFLEKHFPSCGIKFSDSSDCNFLVLQKMCEEINAKLGFYYMLMTNFGFYQNHKKKILDIVQKASHSGEEQLKLSKNAFENEVESDISKEVKDVLNCVVENIVGPEEKSKKESIGQVPKKLQTTLDAQKRVPDSVTATNKASFIENKKKMSSTFQKCKGNSSLTSFLKLKYAKDKFSRSKPAKKPPTKAVTEKSSETVSAVKEKKSETVSAVKETTTSVVSAEKEKNTTIVDPKKVITPKKKAAEEETVVNPDPGPESTKPVNQTEIMDDDDSDIQIIEIKDVQKPTVHSKHCRKRILGKDSRIKVAAKTKVKEEQISESFNTTTAKVVSSSESGNKNSSNKLLPKKDIGFKEKFVISSSKNSASRRVTSVPIQKVSRVDIKSPLSKYSKSCHIKIAPKKESETLKPKIDVLVTKDALSKWKPVISTPINDSPSKPSHALKPVPKNLSPTHLHKSSVERIVRDLSRSPVRRIKSPLKVMHRSPVRKLHRSPVRRQSRSPLKRSSRSPYRKLSKSPRRKSRSPKRHRSRSPLRRHSRSPFRRHSRSPVRRHSRSPVQRRSRSPIRRRSRSPVRRHSRSPVRRQSRSPVRRHSRSPVRRRSKSPLRRRSKSPMSRYSRSPLKWHSRSPSKRHSRSPRRRYSKSPGRQHSFSPIIRRPLSPVKRQRSPVSKLSRGYDRSSSKSPDEEYRNIYKALSSSIQHGIKDRMISEKRYANKYDIDKRIDQSNKEYDKRRAPKRSLSSISDKHKSHSFASSSIRGISDLDPVSDEDESVYFDKQQHLEDIMATSSSKAVQFLQKFAVSNPNLDPSTIKQVMQFFESHKDELHQMIGSTSTSKKEKVNRQVSSSIQENILQQLLLSSLAGSSRESGPSSAPSMQPKFEQPQFLAESIHSGYGLMPNVSPHNLPQYNPSRIFPPNVNMPPPQLYGQLNQPHQELLQKPPQNEGLFKDIKVTINKLFGASEMAQKQENIKSGVPGYVFQPDPEKWDLNHPATPKFSPHSAPNFSGNLNPRFGAPMDQKGLYHPESKNINFNDPSKSSGMRPDVPAMFNRNSNIPGQYTRGLDRPAQNLPVPPPDAKVSFCETSRASSKGNLFPVLNQQGNASFSSSSHASVSDVKVSLAQRLASVLVKVGMTDVPAPLLQEMLMKIGAFSSLPRQDITEAEIISILKRLGYLS